MRRFERTCYGRFAIFFRGIWISIVTLAVLLADAAPAWTGEPEVDFLVLEASECFVTARAKAGGSTDHESDGEGGPCELAGLRETTDRVANAFEFTFCDDFSSRSVSSGGFVQLRGGFSGPSSLEIYVDSLVRNITGGGGTFGCFTEGRAIAEVHFLWTVNIPIVEIEFRPQFACSSNGDAEATIRLGGATFDLTRGCLLQPAVVRLFEGETIAFDVRLKEKRCCNDTELETAFSLRVIPDVVLPHQKISDTQGGFTGNPGGIAFSLWLASLGDLDGDGVRDLVGHGAGGSLWILFLNPDGTVDHHQKIKTQEGGFTGDGPLGDMASLGDLNGDGVIDLAVAGSEERIWIFFLNVDGTVNSQQEISSTQGGFKGIVSDGDQFGESLAVLGDLDGDGVVDLAAGERDDDDGGSDRGAVWILFLDTDGTVKKHQKISHAEGGFTGTLDDGDRFGEAVTALGDFDGDGVPDMAVGNFGDDDGGVDRGAVWILLLNDDGTVKSHQKISNTEGGFTGVLDNVDFFGSSVTSMGDRDRNGVVDLAVGASADDDGGFNRGAVWLLFLNADGTVKSHEKISSTQGGFVGALDDGDRFGVAVDFLGDLSPSEGFGALAVNAWKDDDGGLDKGAVWILFLPEPDPWLQFPTAIGVLFLLNRMRRKKPRPRLFDEFRPRKS